MNINILGTHISIIVVACVAVGILIVLVLLIWLCCALCRRKDGDRRRRMSHSISVENPPGAIRGNQQHVAAVQQRQQQQQQQQHNPPRRAEHHKDLYTPPPSAVSISSVGSNGSIPLPPQPSRRSPAAQAPSSYPNSGQSNASGNGSLFPPPSPALSYASSQTMFTYNDLAMATNSFSEANFLGEGGFGLVHKGFLPTGKAIAVKSLRSNSGQGEREFEAEVEIINRVHHRHLVKLVGFCITGSKRFLVYEYVTNKTLEFHLHGKDQPTMDWPMRLKVALGAAKGLAYLHEDCQPRIIHRDIKAANILIDDKYQAKVADFGLAKLTPEEYTHVTTRVMGTLGYLAPEYASSGRLTEKSDVYSFGVMLLEMITGRRPVDKTQQQYNLVDWARPLLTAAMEDENFNQLVDPRLQFSYKHSEMARMVTCAATCVRKSARSRPLMSQVVRALEGNLSLTDLTEGITPGRSLLHRYETASENSGSQYKRGSKAGSTDFVSSEYDGTTSEYGLYETGSSSEEQTTRELDSEEVKRNVVHFK